MTNKQKEALAERCYKALWTARGGRSWEGKPASVWENLPEAHRNAWLFVAECAEEFCHDEIFLPKKLPKRQDYTPAASKFPSPL